MSNIKVGKENSADINLYYKDWGKGKPIVFSHGWPSGVPMEVFDDIRAKVLADRSEFFKDLTLNVLCR